MVVRVLAFAALTLTLLATAVGCGGDNKEQLPAPVPPDERSPFLGINGDRLIYPLAIEGEVEALDYHLKQIAAAPISFVRSALDWRRIEPDPPSAGSHQRDFAAHDTWVEALAEHGLRWAPIMLGFPAPDWAADPVARSAGCGFRSPPLGSVNFAAFSGALADRYGQGGVFWKEHPELPYLPITEYEIWNEPNFSAFWCPRPDPERFAALTTLSAEAIKRVDPRARIVFGGLAPFQTDPGPSPERMESGEFIARAVTSEPKLADLIDAVAVHPYGVDPDAALDTLRELRQAIERTALAGLPLVANELGWPAAGTSGGFTVVADDELRASYLHSFVTAIVDARAELNIAAIAPYTWVSAETNSVQQEEWFGLADPETAVPYPIGEAYQEAAETIAGQLAP